MTSEGVLRVPLQINGGNGVPTKLKERELYINTGVGSGLLYYGKPDGTVSPITIKDTQNTTANRENGHLFKFIGNQAQIGGLNITANGDKGYKFAPFSKVGNYNVQFSGIRLGSLVLTDSNYGGSLPKSGVEGQIFFLIP